MKILTGTRFLIATAITILVLIFMSGQVGRLVNLGAAVLAVYLVFRMLYQFGYLPAQLAPLAGRVGDKSPSLSQTQQVSQTAPTPHRAPQTIPIERPLDKPAATQEVEEWDDKQFNLDLRSRFVGQDTIDVLEHEVTSYLESSKKRPFICIIEGPERAGKSELFFALAFALGRQFQGNPDPIIQAVSLSIIDDAFTVRPDIATALVDSLQDDDLNDAAMKRLELFARAPTSKMVFLFVKDKASDRLQNLARRTIIIEQPSQADVCHMRFRRLFDEEHNITLEISQTEDKKLGDLLESLVAIEGDALEIRPKDINEQLLPRVAELVETAELFSGETYILKRVPKVPSSGKIRWEGFEFGAGGPT